MDAVPSNDSTHVPDFCVLPADAGFYDLQRMVVPFGCFGCWNWIFDVRLA